MANLKESPFLIPSAEPFLFQGNRVGCLMVHGFTGTPKEMRKLGELLAGQGYTVLGVRLAGHATDIHDMTRTRWWDWAASVEDGVNMLKTCTDHIIIIGLSMGGVLSLYTAARFPVDGVIAMSTPYDLRKDWRLNFTSLLSHIQPTISKGKPENVPPEVQQNHIAYSAYPTISIGDLYELMQKTRDNLSNIKVPVLLMQSRQDDTVMPDSIQNFFDALGTTDKNKIIFEDGGHILTREPTRSRVFEACNQFIKRVIGD